MSEAVNSFEIYRGDGNGRPELLDRLPASPLLFEHRGSYLADPGLVDAVNIALRVGQPLLVTGEPGCGKTRLAWSVAKELGLDEPLTFFTRSDSRAQDLLYSYDAVLRFHDIQAGQAENSERAADPENYIHYEALGRAILDQEKRQVVLVDEIDKAPRDFPNDLLNELVARAADSGPQGAGRAQRRGTFARRTTGASSFRHVRARSGVCKGP